MVLLIVVWPLGLLAIAASVLMTERYCRACGERQFVPAESPKGRALAAEAAKATEVGE